MKLPFDPGIPLLGIYPKNPETQIQRIYAPYVYSSIIYYKIAKIWKQPKCPSVDEWIKKLYICTMEFYAAVKKKEFLPFATAWIEMGAIILSEISQSMKDKYHGFTYKWNLINRIN